MATITETKLTGTGDRAITTTTLTASDTFEYRPGAGQVLTITNDTAGSLTPNITGDGATTVPVAGYGEVDVSSGYDLASIAAGTTVSIPLDSIRKYLSGTITMTGADAGVATLTGY